MGTSAHRNTNASAQHSFAQVPTVSAPRSTFNRSCGVKTTYNFGDLIPFFVDEALPGDTMQLNVRHLARLATLVKPTMENLYLDFFFFAVPNRLVWDNWQRFMGEQPNPGDSTDFVVPTMQADAVDGYDELSLQDYMGIPTKIPNLEHNTLPLRSYNLIVNEWFRDQNLQDSIPVRTGDAGDLLADYSVQPRGKRHDYFTSALPFAQKGDAVELPLGSIAPVVSAGGGGPSITWGEGDRNLETGAVATTTVEFSGASTNNADTRIDWANPDLQADLSNATAATINAIRQAFQIQKLLERDARGGTRYTEILLSHFGVMSPDQRLQRPEYLGGGSSRININPVASTNDFAPGELYLGDLGGFGVSQGQSGIGFSKSFVEHCTVIGIVSARADLNYQQGLERMWSRSTRYDYAWPALAHIGEQEVLNKEIYAQADANDDLTFGYQERYAEYRYKPSKITGRMRSNANQSLDVWHLAQQFDALPLLNADFIREDPPVDRILAVPTEPALIMDGFIDFRHTRPLPVFSVPGFVDHF